VNGERDFDVSSNDEEDGVLLVKFPDEGIFSEVDENEVLDDEVRNDLDVVGYAFVRYKKGLQILHENKDDAQFSDTFSILLFNEDGEEIPVSTSDPI
jgi:hypothetical protein